MMATESEVEVYHKHAFAEYSVNVFEPSIDNVHDYSEYSVQELTFAQDFSNAPSVLD